MPVAKLDSFPTFDLSRKLVSWQVRRAEGKELRSSVPRESHATWAPPKNRPDPVETVNANNQGRQKHLIPLRMGRMASSPFAFLRGSACVMAGDLSGTPITGIPTLMDGDAHLNNFGMYGTPQREVVFDLNDFDEATVGPWEWDLKRLAASVNVAGRQNGLTARERAAAVCRSIEGYRFNMNRLQSMGVLDIWYLHAYPGQNNPIVKADAKSKAVIRKTLSKALHTDNKTLLPKVADQDKDGLWVFRDSPPILTRLDKATKKKVIDSLDAYSETLSRERRIMLARYHVVDVAHRVVGVGSVGTRAYLVLLFGNGNDDPLFLQVKEATTPAHAPYLPKLDKEFTHNGKRVIVGQRALQASSDPMLGYTTIDGRDFYVRQMKNLKASIPIEWLTGPSFNFYAWACGAILARAHARTADPARIAGYCGNSSALDKAIATWAESYGDQTEKDHAALVDAINRGTVIADLSEGEE
ncbi:DUF2252 domain-containing protein [Terriglobus roseus]|uniref:Uncharacterized conserved protein, DUF2252 family n=1 Tax=Terriglobus roseus TaxID=392734 RepID=A0A1G7JBK5_9BACT|nr:DUF2252 domain-containing protein [Terriglobus roseus]SDF22144.1 Uncharacterized conserved protein, DUF2252 family [Terriglobus roseus]